MEKIRFNLNLLEIKAHIFDANIFEFVNTTTNPCYLCARMRRGYLYAKAQELGCNKIALGHHFNDVVETILLGMLYNGTFQTMMPKLHSDNFDGMELIRPFYYIKEKDIIHFCNYHGLEFIDCACLVSKKKVGKRLEMKALTKHLETIYPESLHNLIKATENVNLGQLMGYYMKDESYSFLDDYDRK